MLEDDGAASALVDVGIRLPLTSANFCFPNFSTDMGTSFSSEDLVPGRESVGPTPFPGHPYAVAMETVRLAPDAQVSLYPWKASKDQIPLAVRHIRTFLRAHRPAAAATQPLAAAAQ